jgi:hypothetical protein
LPDGGERADKPKWSLLTNCFYFQYLYGEPIKACSEFRKMWEIGVTAKMREMGKGNRGAREGAFS